MPDAARPLSANDNNATLVPFKSFARAMIARDRGQRRRANAGLCISREGVLLAAILGALAECPRKRDRAFLQRVSLELEALQHRYDGALGPEDARRFFEGICRSRGALRP